MTDVPRPRTLDFSAETREIWGDTTVDLERLDELFSPHSFNEFRDQPEVMRTVFDEAMPHMERCKAELRKFMMIETFGLENPHISRNPRSYCIDVMHRVSGSIGELYPAWLKPDAAFIQAIYLNFIYHSVISEWYVHLMKNPTNKHAAKAIRILMTAAELLGPADKTVGMMNLVASMREFFRTHPVLTYPINHLSLPELKDINARLFETAQRLRHFEVPQSVCHEEDVSREPLCLTSDGIERNSGRYGFYDAEFSLYDGSFESRLIRPGVISGLRVMVDAPSFETQHVVIHGKSATFALERFHGEIHGGLLATEGLKVLMGEKDYETLRAYLLFRYAQLVCDEDDFVENFGSFITLVEPPPPVRGPAPPKGTGSGGTAEPLQPWAGKLPVRFFPRGYRGRLGKPAPEERDAEATGRHIRGRRTDPHRRLLPFGWHPTNEAFEKAREEGANLLAVFETFMEETEDGPRERRFTYVTGHAFGNVPEAVRAVYRHRTLEVSEPKS